VSPASRKGHHRNYVYYRCVGTDAYRFGGQRVCMNGQVRQDRLDDMIWNDVRTLLSDPQRLVRELERRRTSGSADATGEHQAKLRLAAGKVQRGIARLIDAYGEGLLNKTEFEPRITAAKEQLAKLQGELQSRIDQEAQSHELRLVIDNLEAFARQVTAGLDSIDWNAKRDVIRVLVKRVEIEKEQVKVVYRVDTSPFDLRPNRGILHYCWRRAFAVALESGARRIGQGT
jgi:site-specific DNA recombinase